jgi:hypothetical protein
MEEDVVDAFVNGLFANMVTRRQGKIAEILIQAEELFDGPDSIHHDLRDNVADDRIEVKCSKVQEKHTDTVTSDNFVTQCIEHDPANRRVNYDEREGSKWSCNIQQIKTTEFEKLYYVLFFKDRVCVFCIGPDEIAEDQRVNYCPTQHGGGKKEKEEGQFHVTNHNINYHIETYLHNQYTYREFIEMFPDADSL